MLNLLKMCLRLDHSSDAAFGQWFFAFFLPSRHFVLATLSLFLVRLWISVHFAWSLSA